MLPYLFSRVSLGFNVVERFLLKFLIASLAIFVLLNVFLRMFGITFAWADEVSIYTMLLSGFVGASLMLRARNDPAVLLLHEFLPARGVRFMRILVSSVSAGFGILLFYICLRWFNPVALSRVGFDVSEFQAATFNFIYTDVTSVMGIPTFLLYLIVPLFAVAITVHAVTNLFEDFGLLERPSDPAGLKMDAST